jgi:transposase
VHSVVDAPCAKAVRIDAQKKTFRATEQLTREIQVERRAFLKDLALVPEDKCIVLDETGCNRAMAKRHAWAPRGMRALSSRPGNHGPNITIVGAIRQSGTVAMRTMIGAMTSERFIAFVAEALIPRLREGDVVIMDNLRAHHAPDVVRRIEEAGALVRYLPPYSPDLSPIEFVWSTLKRNIEKRAARCSHTVRRAARAAWATLARRNFRPLFDACGYP